MIKERCVTIIPWYSQHNSVIADITKYERKTSGKFKEKKRKRSHDSQSGPKQGKKTRKRGLSLVDNNPKMFRGTDLRERIDVKHSVVKHFRYRYQWM